jgi:PKD repeat protein
MENNVNFACQRARCYGWRDRFVINNFLIINIFWFMKFYRITPVFLIIVTVLFLADLSFAQISREGVPPSFSAPGISDDYQVIELPSVSQDIMDHLDDNLANGPGPYRIGKMVPVNASIDDAGTWTDLPYGGKIWRLELRSPGALALSLYYDHFWLPKGGELYLYNEGKTQVIGAFTDFNNDDSGLFATEIIQGESLTLEYYQPEENTGQPVISISDMAYIVRGVIFSMVNNPDVRDQSWWCMINVNCPEGDNWQYEKKGVVREYLVLPQGWVGWCSGSLVNNTTWDLTPYMFTAYHCGEGCSAAQLAQWIFYFKYESSTCSGTIGPTNFTVTGSTLKAQGSIDTGSDFLLLKLNSNPPSSCEPYWNGWNRSNNPSPSGVGIHHPMGDIKKISTYNTPLLHSQWDNNGVLSHWKVAWAETVNGTSIIQEGSSGSPLFDNEHRIVGTLTGSYINMTCENPGGYSSFYGKVYWSWDQMGSQPEQQLKYWLDPDNTGEMYLSGTDGNVPQANFEANDITIPLHGTVNFTDLSQGGPTSWSWSFAGGTPSSSIERNPQGIVYDSYGSYTVSLTITNPFGSDTETKVAYIQVDDPPMADFTANHTAIGVGETVTFNDASQNDPLQWHWQFQGGTPSTSFNQNPAPIHYNTAGVFQVKLTATNDFGSNTMTKDNFITVYGAPVPDFTVDSAMIPVGYTVNFTDMTYGAPTSWLWTFQGGTPSGSIQQNPQGIVYNSSGDYSVTLAVTSPYGSNDTTKVAFITVVPPPTSNFLCINRYIIVGSSTYFTDQSTNDPDSWEWIFEGGNPATSNQEAPGPIQYNAPGAFDVSLTVGNMWGFGTVTKPGYIRAGYVPTADFTADQTVIVEGESVNFTDLSTENPDTWNWVFEGGTPATSNLQNPTNIVYPDHGVYDVTLTVFNDFGQNTKTETDYIIVGSVGIDESKGSRDGIYIFPNPTTGAVNVLFLGKITGIISLDVFNAIGDKVFSKQEKDYDGRNIQVDLSGQQTGLYLLRIRTSDQVIIRKITLTR